MVNATLAFCILALTSSSVPPLLLIVLPRYVNESVSSSGSPFIVMGLLFFVLAFIILVLLLLMLTPSCVDIMFSSSVFSALHPLMAVDEESEVIRKVLVLQLVPRWPLDTISSVSVVFFMIHTMTRKNKNGDRRYSSFTPVFTMKESVSCHV